MKHIRFDKQNTLVYTTDMEVQPQEKLVKALSLYSHEVLTQLSESIDSNLILAYKLTGKIDTHFYEFLKLIERALNEK